MTTATVHIGRDLAGYETLLAVKRLPRYRLRGRVAEFPAEYAGRLGLKARRHAAATYAPPPFLFDYQRAVSELAVRRERFAVFMRCGLGKTLVMLEFARHASAALRKRQCVLIVSPLMVCAQTVAEARRFYGDALPVEHVRAAGLQAWLDSGKGRIGITNYEAITDGLRPGRLGALILDESSVLKSHYGAWGARLIELGRGLRWKLCLTGTPAPNDRIEYATHAVFLDQHPSVNSFLARYFVNRGQTGERWELKPHALRPFYRALSHWCIFLNDPATYGWKDNVGAIPPVIVHVHDVPMTGRQKEIVSGISGDLFGSPGGMVRRGKLSQLAKGRHGDEAIESAKPGFVRDLIASWQADEQTLVWCRYNAEQEALSGMIPGSVSIEGSTAEDARRSLLDGFLAGRNRTMITKPKVLGFGLNLQCATRHVFSSCEDSYESYHQAVSRSNRVGSSRPLNVHLPVTEIERPMMENVLRKAAQVDRDTAEQEAIFKEEGWSC
jgi:superfamily II DNA or RNA helicase